MKPFLCIILSALLAQFATAQSFKQVHWTYSAKKITDKTYEIHMSATISGDYHLYAQDAGGDGPVPTAFTFVKSPLLLLDGPVRENGKLIRKFESTWGHDVKYYEHAVDFVQTVKVKGSAKVNIAGKVEFMVCNERLCEQPSTIDIKVNIGG